MNGVPWYLDGPPLGSGWSAVDAYGSLPRCSGVHGEAGAVPGKSGDGPGRVRTKVATGLAVAGKPCAQVAGHGGQAVFRVCRGRGARRLAIPFLSLCLIGVLPQVTWPVAVPGSGAVSP